MKVVATDASKKYNLRLKEVHRIVEEGEVFEVSEARANFLMGANPYGVVFVKKVSNGECEYVKNTSTKEKEQSNIVLEPKHTTTSTTNNCDSTVGALITDENNKPSDVTEEEPEVIIIKPKRKSKKKDAVEE